jgi:hypothetical protein
MNPLSVLVAPNRTVAPTGSRPRASIQGTTLDLLWIRDSVVCFAGARSDAPLFRAVLALDGPVHTPRAVAAIDPGALAGYRALLGQLDHPLQVLVRTELVDVAARAARWDARAAVLPDPLAVLAREHAAWIRRELPTLGLLIRSAYLVVPAEDPREDSSPAAALRQRLRRQPVPTVTVGRARTVLAERCARLLGALQAAGVRARRLDDLALARLYRACWNPAGPDADHLDRDLVATFGRTP